MAMLLVGLTGNYGMGKSTVLAMFKKLGAHVIDSDEIVKILLEEKSVLAQVKKVLGSRVFRSNGSLDKGKVADAIFKDNRLRQAMEDLMHPLVFDRIHSLLGGIKNKDKVIIIEVPLLFERNYGSGFNRTITVHTEEDTALYRLENKGVNREEALLRTRAQLPIDEKVRKSDYCIDNKGSSEETLAQVKEIYKKLLKEATDAGF
jgi:dephospho-CoA kinase